MLGTRIDLELAVHGAAQRALRQHALDGDFDHALRVALQRLLNDLETHAQTPAPARYVHGETRVLLAEDSDLESLG